MIAPRHLKNPNVSDRGRMSSGEPFLCGELFASPANNNWMERPDHPDYPITCPKCLYTLEGMSEPIDGSYPMTVEEFLDA